MGFRILVGLVLLSWILFGVAQVWERFKAWRLRRLTQRESAALQKRIKESIERAARYGGVHGVFDPGPQAPVSFIVRQRRANERAMRAEREAMGRVGADIIGLLGAIEERDHG